MKIGILVSCSVDEFSPKRAENLITYLLSMGYETHYPMEQTCCGRLLYEAGDEQTAHTLLEKTHSLYKDCNYIICTCYQCSKYLKKEKTLKNKVLTIEEFLEKIEKPLNLNTLPFNVHKIENFGSLEILSVINPVVCNALIEKEINKALNKGANYIYVKDENYYQLFDNYIKKNKIDLKIFHIIDLLSYVRN